MPRTKSGASRAKFRDDSHWQALEPNTAKFYGQGGTPHSLFDIADHIKTLQGYNLVRSDQDYQVLSGIIFSLASYAFFDFANAFNLSKEQKDAHKRLVYEILIQTLKPKDDPNESK